MNEALTALSPLDGRYASKMSALRPLLGEEALIRHRVKVEIFWLLHLANEPSFTAIAPLSETLQEQLNSVHLQFDLEDAQYIKQIERTTHHDVKAVEYFVQERLGDAPELAHLVPFVHFGATSEDINTLAYALMLQGANEVLCDELEALIQWLVQEAHEHAAVPMLARTHGQSASPTTVGKEWANMAYRLKQGLKLLSECPLSGKWNGATGNMNALHAAVPEVSWPAVAQRFVTSLGLAYHPYTTQIEPHDALSTLMAHYVRTNTVLLDLSRDVWQYIALGYFQLKVVAGEVGSSTMPHKVNPIDFENAEGNLGVANALLVHYMQKLPISRLQRDLSDSTVFRTLGTAYGHMSVAYQNLLQGLHKLALNKAALASDLDAHPEVLAEAIQSVLRLHGVHDAYDQLKAFSRGKVLNHTQLIAFIETLDLPQETRQVLKDLTPSAYTGVAETLARRI